MPRLPVRPSQQARSTWRRWLPHSLEQTRLVDSNVQRDRMSEAFSQLLYIDQLRQETSMPGRGETGQDRFAVQSSSATLMPSVIFT